MFDFRLMSILKLREYNVDLCREEVSSCLKRLQLKEDEINRYRQKVIELEEVKRTRDKEKVNIEYFIEWENYRLFLEKQINMLIEQREICKKELTNARNKLLEMMKDKKVIYKLKDKEYQRYLYDQDKNEQKVLDDLAVSRTSSSSF